MGFLRRRKPKPPEPRREDTVYVHLALDGGIFVIRGETGEQLWTDREGLRAEIEHVRDRPSALLLYSREGPNTDPPPHVVETFEELIGFTQEKMPVQLLEEPHPEALVPPDQRRTIAQTAKLRRR
jgi:hypothetical protein